MAREAGQKALADAKIPYDAGRAGGGRLLLRRLDLRASAPSTRLASRACRSTTSTTTAPPARRRSSWPSSSSRAGIVDCAMALGFEKMEKGSLGIKYTDRTVPMDKHMKAMIEKRGFAKAPAAPQMFGNAGREHMEKYGTKPEVFARIGHKNHKHSVNNPYSQFQDEYSPRGHPQRPDGLRPADQAAVLPDERTARVRRSSRARSSCKKHGLHGARRSRSPAWRWRPTCRAPSTRRADIKLVGFDMSQTAARKAYQQSGLGPENAQVDRAARLLQRQRADHLRGARPLRRSARPAISSMERRHHLRRQVGRESVGRADLEGPPARRDRPRAVCTELTCSSSAATPTSARSPVRRRRSSTTSGSAARPSWRCIASRRSGATQRRAECRGPGGGCRRALVSSECAKSTASSTRCDRLRTQRATGDAS